MLCACEPTKEKGFGESQVSAALPAEPKVLVSVLKPPAQTQIHLHLHNIRIPGPQMSLLSSKLGGSSPERDLGMTEGLEDLSPRDLAGASHLCLPICGMGAVILLPGYY